MTRIFCFPSGENMFNVDLFEGMHFHTACAITENGRWIAGAVSQSEETAVERVMEMAKAKAPTMLSGEWKVERPLLGDPDLNHALREAFRRMP